MRQSEIEIAFDDRHRSFQAWLDRFVADSIAPIAADEEDHPEAAFNRYRKALGASGLLKELVPAAYGGRRDTLDLRTICLAREKLAWESGLADLLFVMQGLGSFPVLRGGTEFLKTEWLPKVANAEAIAALALTEEFAGSDVSALATLAREDGDDFVLNGEKWFISNAGVASFYSVFATVDPSLGRKGITCFFVEADRPGCTVPRLMRTLAPHPLGVVRFEECRIPKAHVLGQIGSGFGLAMETLDAFRTSVGAAALGMAGRALSETIDFVTHRKQFGKALSEFQMTQAALADMAVEYDAARLLVYRAAYARDRGDLRVTREASMAKLFATEAAQRIVDRAVQLHGGRGLLHGNITERLYRDVRALRIYEGTTEIQKLVIAAQLLKDHG